MWIAMLLLLLLGVQVNLSWLVPLKAGQPQTPWWVGGRLLWPFAEQTRTLVPQAGLGTLLSLILATGSALCFLLAAAALLRWWVPAAWFTPLIVIGAIASIALHVIYINVWSIFPILVDAALLFAVFGLHLSVSALRG
jgi:hypothetical protein